MMNEQPYVYLFSRRWLRERYGSPALMRGQARIFDLYLFAKTHARASAKRLREEARIWEQEAKRG